MNAGTLKTDLMAQWIATSWLPHQTDQDRVTIRESISVLHNMIVERFDRTHALQGGYTFDGELPVDCPVIQPVHDYRETGEITNRTGAYVYRFKRAEDVVEVLVIGSYFTDEHHKVCVASVPSAFMPTWTEFSQLCQELSGALDPIPKVRVIGGRGESFKPDVDWENIILPAEIKAELMRDVESFFEKGIGIYQRLNLKPFRKLLLAGVPGTGKTMICSALARWALEREYLVIYISSADYSGAAFWKIEEALNVASKSGLPALILLEELDAYVTDEEEKALVLNVLDGTEGKANPLGTLLIGTTNYPEAIDERVLKRPGRLDRVFIIPETQDAEAAERMLRHYLGEYWQDAHRSVARDAVGYPGAFIREVAIYALTQMAYSDQETLSEDQLRRSFDRLLDQITAKDDFLTRQRNNGFGFVVAAK